MTVTLAVFAFAVSLSRRWLLKFFARHLGRVDRTARLLWLLGAAPVTLVGLLPFSAELA